MKGAVSPPSDLPPHPDRTLYVGNLPFKLLDEDKAVICQTLQRFGSTTCILFRSRGLRGLFTRILVLPRRPCPRWAIGSSRDAKFGWR